MTISLYPILEIIRLEELTSGTIGILRINKQVTGLFTLEQNDRLNQKNVSSIPAQQYLCQRYLSPTYGTTFMVLDVPQRDAILFHWGNWKENTEGCILLGSSIMHKPRRGIGMSKQSFEQFMGWLEGHNIVHLTIKEDY